MDSVEDRIKQILFRRAWRQDWEHFTQAPDNRLLVSTMIFGDDEDCAAIAPELLARLEKWDRENP